MQAHPSLACPAASRERRPWGHCKAWQTMAGKRWPCCCCWLSCTLGLVGRYSSGWLTAATGSTWSMSCRNLWTGTSACDVHVADSLLPSRELSVEKLCIPSVYTIWLSTENTVELLCGGLPAPSSYVPAILNSLADKTVFTERLKNMFSYALQDLAYHYVLWGHWNQFYSDILGKTALTCRDYTYCTHRSAKPEPWC